MLEVWRTHDEINFVLLERIPDEGFAALTLLKNGQPSKGRNVSRVFAHMHEVRRAHITREFLKGVPAFETSSSPSRAELLDAFRASSSRIERCLAKLVETRERIKDRTGLVLLGYLLSHDSHHRGQIMLALKQSAVRIPEEFRFGIWQHWFKPTLAVETHARP